MALWFNQRSRRTARLARRLHDVTLAFFTCLLSPDYPESLYLYERRLHEAKREVMRVLLAMKAAGDASVAVAEQIEAALLDVIQLRSRVQDVSLFVLCQLELRGLRAALLACFRTLRKGACDEGHLQWLDAQISQIEGITETVLSVSAPDPRVFEWFIFALKRLRLALSLPLGVL